MIDMRSSHRLTTLLLFFATPLSFATAQTNSVSSRAAAIEESPDVAVLQMGEDVYGAGETVMLERAVSGDALVVGGTVHIAQNVGQDVQAAGGTVIVDANVGDDVRLAGGTISLNGDVKGNVLIMGGDIRLDPGTVIDGDTMIRGGHVRIEGSIQGNLTVYAETVLVNGTVNGNLELHANQAVLTGRTMGSSVLSANRLSLGNTAFFGEKVRYWQSAGPVNFSEKARDEALFDLTLEHTMPHANDRHTVATLVLLYTLFSVVSAIVMIGLLLWATKTFFKDTAKHLLKKPGKSFVWGFLYFIAMPVIGVLLLFTIIGIPLGFAVLLSYALALLLAKALTAIVWIRTIELQHHWKFRKSSVFGLSIVAYLALKLLSMIPIIGWLACGILMSMAFGALIMTKKEKLEKIL